MSARTIPVKNIVSRTAKKPASKACDRSSSSRVKFTPRSKSTAAEVDDPRNYVDVKAENNELTARYGGDEIAQEYDNFMMQNFKTKLPFAKKTTEEKIQRLATKLH